MQIVSSHHHGALLRMALDVVRQANKRNKNEKKERGTMNLSERSTNNLHINLVNLCVNW